MIIVRVAAAFSCGRSAALLGARSNLTWDGIDHE